jgi:hypothetical protein
MLWNGVAVSHWKVSVRKGTKLASLTGFTMAYIMAAFRSLLRLHHRQKNPGNETEGKGAKSEWSPISDQCYSRQQTSTMQEENTSEKGHAHRKSAYYLQRRPSIG